MKQFKRIYVEITNVCNLDCPFCPKTERAPGFMSVDLFKRILEEVKDHSRYLYFHVMGEPLLHPDIDVFLDICHDKGFKVNITTNGTLIKTTKDKILSKPAVRLINFSLHIFDENTGTGIIDEYLDEIFSFVAEAPKSSDLIACLRLWNAGGSKDFSGHTGENSYILKRIEKFFHLPHGIEEMPSKGNGIKIADKVYVDLAACFEWPDNKLEEMGDEGFCLGLRDQVAILVDGTVVPCCLDSEGTIDLGNIKNTAFSGIIGTKRAMDIYNGFSGRKAVESLCRKCGYRKRFDLGKKEKI